MLRTYRVNFPKNWVCQPSKWNLFWSNLEADMNDLLDEFDNTSFSFDNVNYKDEEIIIKVGKDDRVKYPQL